MTRPSARLARLTERVNALAPGRPLPLVAVVRPADADHPPGTRVSVGQGVDVYHDFAAGGPDLPPLDPNALIIVLHPDGDGN